MNWQNDNSSVLFIEEDDSIDKYNTLAWYQPETKHDEAVVFEEKRPAKGSSYLEEKKETEDSEIPVEPTPIELGYMVKEYENWEGRIIFIDKDFIRARLYNTQRMFSPRMIQISKSIFIAEGIKKQLSIGDMFELSFKRVRKEFFNKKQELAQKENSIESIRMIEPVSLSLSEIEAITAKELESLSYLFK